MNAACVNGRVKPGQLIQLTEIKKRKHHDVHSTLNARHTNRTHKFTTTFLCLNLVLHLHLHHANSLLQFSKLDARQRLHQYVCQMIICNDILDQNPFFCNTFTHEVITNVNVLAFSMMNRVLHEINSRLVVNLQKGRFSGRTKYLTQQSSKPNRLTGSRRRCHILCFIG
jgi:hypothetical protein